MHHFVCQCEHMIVVFGLYVLQVPTQKQNPIYCQGQWNTLL